MDLVRLIGFVWGVAARLAEVGLGPLLCYYLVLTLAALGATMLVAHIVVGTWWLLSRRRAAGYSAFKRPSSSRHFEFLDRTLKSIRELDEEAGGVLERNSGEDGAVVALPGLEAAVRARGRRARLARSAFLASEACEEQVRDSNEVQMRIVRFCASASVLIGFLGTLFAFSSLAPDVLTLAMQSGQKTDQGVVDPTAPDGRGLEGLEVVFYPAAVGIFAAILWGVLALVLSYFCEKRLAVADSALRIVLRDSSGTGDWLSDPYSNLTEIQEAADSWKVVLEGPAQKLQELCEHSRSTAEGVTEVLGVAKDMFRRAAEDFSDLARSTEPFKKAAIQILDGAEKHDAAGRRIEAAGREISEILVRSTQAVNAAVEATKESKRQIDEVVSSHTQKTEHVHALFSQSIGQFQASNDAFQDSFTDSIKQFMKSNDDFRVNLMPAIEAVKRLEDRTEGALRDVGAAVQTSKEVAGKSSKMAQDLQDTFSGASRDIKETLGKLKEELPDAMLKAIGLAADGVPATLGETTILFSEARQGLEQAAASLTDSASKLEEVVGQVQHSLASLSRRENSATLQAGQIVDPLIRDSQGSREILKNILEELRAARRQESFLSRLLPWKFRGHQQTPRAR